MSQQNVEAVHRFFDAYNRRDREAVGALLHPAVEWHSIGGPVFGLEAMHGRDEQLRFMFELIPDGLEDFRVTAEEVSELPDGRVLALSRYEGRGVGSGAKVEMTTAAIYRFDAGMIVFFEEFPTQEDALQALGLTP
jgi:ketosteroid isomerase-like protein